MKKRIAGMAAGLLTLTGALPALAEPEATAQPGNWFSQMMANDPNMIWLLIIAGGLVVLGFVINLITKKRGK
ncbi:MAG: hypothetical protein PHD32_11305 [Eubacteriales bacterium]|nr:hypothetical protein [Eubacteriales bacterium]